MAKPASIGHEVGSPAQITEAQQYLTFLLNGEMYAIAILNVKEIIEYGQITDIPMMPAFIRGVINLRGSVVPVIDLAARFGKDSAPVSKRTCIVIIEVAADSGHQDIGIVVDSVSEVLEIPHRDIEPPPGFGASIRTDFISGMGKIAGKFVIILALDKVLSVEEMVALSSIAQAESPEQLGATDEENAGA